MTSSRETYDRRQAQVRAKMWENALRAIESACVSLRDAHAFAMGEWSKTQLLHLEGVENELSDLRDEAEYDMKEQERLGYGELPITGPKSWE